MGCIMNSLTLIYVSIAGLFGVLLRYGCYHFFSQQSLTLPTLIVNGLGCFILGGIVALSEQVSMSEPLKIGLIIGGCGALTTFSTIIFDLLKLLQQQEFTQAVVYFVFTNILGVALFGLGFFVIHYVAKWFV